MTWWAGAIILATSAVVLRRLLRTGSRPARPPAGWLPLRRDQEALYQPVAQEVETLAAIMAISLNDALEERAVGRLEIAWHLVRLAASQWDRAAETLAALHRVMGKYMPEARVAIPLRSMSSHRFKSRAMTDFFRMYELLDQLVFRSKLRFQLQIGVLRRATETLSREFRGMFDRAERLAHRPPEFWKKLDPYFHDFDLLGKETLLALRAFLACLPEEALGRIAADLSAAVRRSTHSAPLSARG